MFAAPPLWLTDAAVTAAAVTTLLGFVGVFVRMSLKFSIVRSFFSWIREGWAEDRAEALDRALAFNGTGRFRSDMREFYANVNAFMISSAADQRVLHDRIDRLTNQGEQR